MAPSKKNNVINSPFNNKPQDVAYGLLGQISLLHDIPLYAPEGNQEMLAMLKNMGAKVHTSQIGSGTALYYKYHEGYHYLKLVGPNCPKGGGLYLCQKMDGNKFLEWLEGFTRGILLRDIRDRINNPTANSEMLKAIPNDPFNLEVVPSE